MSSRFLGRTVLITGGGSGLGRAYALNFAKLGANVVVNDLPDSEGAHNVVESIKNQGGKAIVNSDNIVSESSHIIQHALSAYNGLDIIINNAGILRDKTFIKSEPSHWYDVLDVHLNGSYSVTRAAWNHMMESNYGRIVNIVSGSGLYGNHGQASYSAAKMALVGLTSTLALEGKASNIQVNCVAPVAATAMTQDLLPAQILKNLNPFRVSPLVMHLAHEECKESGKVFECGGGWYSQVKWQRSPGFFSSIDNNDNNNDNDDNLVAEMEKEVADNMHKITDFSIQDLNVYPSSPMDALQRIIQGPLRKVESIGGQEARSKAGEKVVEKGEIQMMTLDSDVIFDKVQSHLQESDGPQAIASQIGTRVIKFVLTEQGKCKIWTLDCIRGNDSDNGEIDQASKASISSTVEAESEAMLDTHEGGETKIICSDSTLMALFREDTSPEWAFATGQLKVVGSMGVALKLKDFFPYIRQL